MKTAKFYANFNKNLRMAKKPTCLLSVKSPSGSPKLWTDTRRWRWMPKILFTSKTLQNLVRNQKLSQSLSVSNSRPGICTAYPKERQVLYWTLLNHLNPITCLIRIDSLTFTRQTLVCTVVCPTWRATRPTLTLVWCGWTQLPRGLTYSVRKTRLETKLRLEVSIAWVDRSNFSYSRVLFRQSVFRNHLAILQDIFLCHRSTHSASISANTNISPHVRLLNVRETSLSLDSLLMFSGWILNIPRSTCTLSSTK